MSTDVYSKSAGLAVAVNVKTFQIHPKSEESLGLRQEERKSLRQTAFTLVDF